MTNVKIHRRVAEHIGKYDIVKKMKLRWFGHVVIAKGTLANINQINTI